MIIAKILINKDKEYESFIVKGHAGYDERGRDIVCAAVSILTINTINSIEKFSSTKFKCEMEDTIKFKFLDHPDDKAALLMDSMILGLGSIQKNYGTKVLKLEIKETKEV